MLDMVQLEIDPIDPPSILENLPQNQTQSLRDQPVQRYQHFKIPK